MRWVNSEDRCHTDPDEQDTNVKQSPIPQRIMHKSMSCESHLSFQQTNESVNTSYMTDQSDLMELLLEDKFMELDAQRDEKIYRIVQHYNGQINNLRELGMFESTIIMMEELEKIKWEQIMNVHNQFEDIKSSLQSSLNQK